MGYIGTNRSVIIAKTTKNKFVSSVEFYDAHTFPRTNSNVNFVHNKLGLVFINIVKLTTEKLDKINKQF